MALRVFPFLLAVLCAASLLHAGVVSDDDKRSAGDVDNVKTSVADDTKTGDKKTGAVSSPAVEPDHSRTRREDGSKRAGSNPSYPATSGRNQQKNQKLPTIPENSRIRRAAQSQGMDADGPKAPWITDRHFLMRPASAADDGGPSARALHRNTRGATVVTSNKSPPASASTNDKSKVSSPAVDNKKTSSSVPTPGKKPASAQ